jgi:hypothetical protein
MGCCEHFDGGDEMKEEGKAAEMNADLPPALDGIKHGGENRDTGRSVEDRRDSEPK